MKPSSIARNCCTEHYEWRKIRVERQNSVMIKQEALCELEYLRIHGGKESSIMKEAFNP